MDKNNLGELDYKSLVIWIFFVFLILIPITLKFLPGTFETNTDRILSNATLIDYKDRAVSFFPFLLFGCVIAITVFLIWRLSRNLSIHTYEGLKSLFKFKR